MASVVWGEDDCVTYLGAAHDDIPWLGLTERSTYDLVENWSEQERWKRFREVLHSKGWTRTLAVEPGVIMLGSFSIMNGSLVFPTPWAAKVESDLLPYIRVRSGIRVATALAFPESYECLRQ